MDQELAKALEEVSELEERYLKAGEKTDELPPAEKTPEKSKSSEIFTRMLLNALENARFAIHLAKDNADSKVVLSTHMEKLDELGKQLDDAVDGLIADTEKSSKKEPHHQTSNPEPEEEEPEEEEPEEKEPEEVETGEISEPNPQSAELEEPDEEEEPEEDEEDEDEEEEEEKDKT